MKKHTWLIALLLTVAVAASLFLVGCTPAEQQSVTPPGTEQEEPQGGDPGGGDEDPPVLSSDTSLTVESVGGVKAEGGAVTLTTAQYEAFAAAQDKGAACEYTLAEKASVTVTLEGTVLKFAVTAEDGTQKDYTVTLTVLSNDVSFRLNAVCGETVSDEAVTLSEQQFYALQEDLAAVCDYTAAQGASVTASYETETHSLVFTVVSQDRSATGEYTTVIAVHSPFGSNSLNGYGSADNVSWSFADGGYLLSGAAFALDERDVQVMNDWSFSCNVAIKGLAENSEVVFSSYQTDNLVVRFVLRGESGNRFILFSDYRDMTGFKNYTEHIVDLVYEEGEELSFRLINLGNSLVMIYKGETVYRRTLDTLTHSELCISTVTCSAVLSDLEIVTDRALVEAAYQDALQGYPDPMVGATLIGNADNIAEFTQNEDGTLTVLGSRSNARVMSAIYGEGVPYGGYQYAVSGSVRVTNTKTTGPSASKVEFQIYTSFQNFIKFHLFRYPTNNSFYAYPTINTKMSTIACESNTMPQGTDYTLDFIFIYDHGRIEAWLKDGDYMPEYKCVYTLETDWGYTGFALAMRQYCDVTFSGLSICKNAEYDALWSQLHAGDADLFAMSAQKDTAEQSSVFTDGGSNIFYKGDQEYGKAFLFADGVPVAGDAWMVSGTFSYSDYRNWGQCELQVWQDDTHAVRYVFEYVPGGTFQVFTEIRRGNAMWQNYKLIQRPQTANPAYLNFTVVNYGGAVSFLIDGYVWHSYEDAGLSAPAITFGGQNCIMKLSGLSAVTDEAAVGEFAANMQEYSYVSPYESRIAALAEEYAGAQKGGVLLAGSSTIDFWDTWQEDIGADTLGYNVGIGGTVVEDWLYAYDRLVAPFEPGKIVLFLGGNNVNNLGDSGEATAKLLAELLEKMHADFPEAEIYYVLSLPVPNNFAHGVYTTEYGNLIECMKAYGEQNDWLTVIDMEDALTENGEPIAEYFRSDGIHMTAAGYAVWSAIINEVVFGK